MMKPAFDDIVKKYINLVYFFTKRSIKEQEIVDDIVQETFLKAFKTYDTFTFKSEGELKSWLLTICRNSLTDKYRGKKKMLSIETHNIEILDENDLDAWLAQQSKESDIAKIRQTLQHMKAAEQEIVRLRIFEDMTFKEIAIALDITEATAKMRFYRTIEKLKEAVV